MKANEADTTTVEVRGGPGGGNAQVGLMVDGGKVDATAGSIKITGNPGNVNLPGVKVPSPGWIRTEGKEP